MTKNMLIALGVVLGVSFLLNIVQLTGGFSKRKQIKKLNTSLVQVEEKAGSLASTNSELELNVINLTAENETLIDSVTQLNETIHKLRSTISNQKKRLAEIQNSMNILKEKHDALNRQISLAADMNDGSDKIAALEADKKSLNEKIQALESKSRDLSNAKDALYEQVIEKEAEKQKYIQKDVYHQDLLDIIEVVKVEFYDLTPRREKGKPAKSHKKWIDTKINFALDYDDLSKLKGEEFVVRIVDTKTGEILAPKEVKDNSKGISFIFEGNPAPEMIYTNFDDKEDGIFAVQIYLKRENRTYLLNQGIASIEF